MNASNPDPFETRLASQPLRRPPPEWRSEILAAAMRSQSATEQLPARGVPGGFLTRLSEVLWPSPFAWGGLAAVWLALAAFNATSPRATLVTTEDSSAAAKQLHYAFRDQNQLLKELIGQSESSEPKRRTPPTTKPRTELRKPYVSV